ncbi:hypothetical protein [Cohnella candidum]|uniref:Uncharacterized protein n=1 Tax=Cohnella candidum TaxID=2674991 RepID=A0A3G3JV51_9BACL|nr:hypothetical protein [Cohnella candidum]AYQ72096.1 hypothetical protein EAV92_05635 [Cohnella candidum]
MAKRKRKKRGNRSLTIVALLFLVLSLIFFAIDFFRAYNPGKLSLSAPFGLGNIELDRATLSEKELDIAWKLYVQLSTRKASIPLDDNDIISEVYDSWYQLFTTTREYLIEMPAKDIEENENAQKIIALALDVINKGLRPHLTEWQGKYRKWYNEAIQKEEFKGKSPQEIQKKYPHYNELIDDMKIVNTELLKYATQLKRFSHEKPANNPTKIITWFKEKWKSSF